MTELAHDLLNEPYTFNSAQWSFVMANATHYTLETKLKAIPASEDIKQTHSEQLRKAKQKADYEWQMNLAKLKLGALKGENKAACDSLNGFHDAARKSLLHARRAS